MRVTSITPMKNEGPFILEWVAYHQAIGINDILVFTNDCTDGTDIILERLDEMGVLRHYPNPSMSVEFTKHHWMVMNYVNTMPRLKRSDYYINIDVDEFICINTGDGRITDLIAAMGDADILSACQLNFGCDGHVEWDSAALVIDQFTRSMKRDDTQYATPRPRGLKSLVRCGANFKRIGNHAPYVTKVQRETIKWINAAGAPVNLGTLADRPKSFQGTDAHYDLVQINHYAVRSMENFLMKSARGNANHADEPISLDYFRYYDLNDMVDTRITRWSAAVRERISDLLQDRELAALNAKTIAFHQKQIAEARATPSGQELMQRLRRFHRRNWMTAPVKT